jgi:hypothetical protein
MKLNNYKELDKKYTEAEYLLLKSKFSPPAPLSEAIYDYLYKEDIFFYPKQKNYRSISEYLRNVSKDFFDVMYEKPLEQMPLYINGSASISSIASWRLELGK